MGATLGAVREAIAEARGSGAQVALTASDSTLVERHRDDLLQVLADGVDVLFANADEARTLGGSHDLAEASSRIAGLCPLVATTDGHKGSAIYGLGRAGARVASSVISQRGARLGAEDARQLAARLPMHMHLTSRLERRGMTRGG